MDKKDLEFENTEGFGDMVDEKGNDIPIEQIESTNQIDFENTTLESLHSKRKDMRRVPVPMHRMTPLKNQWEKVVNTVVENMKLQIRMNTKKKCVEIKSSEYTEDSNAIQKAVDFLKAFMLGFDLNDAIAMLRLEDLYIESFDVKDVKNLTGDHLSRCIGRISGEKGKTKYAIENSTKTRIVLADSRIHVLGSFSNIKVARDAICSLILGSPPGKIYSSLKFIAKRQAEKY